MSLNISWRDDHRRVPKDSHALFGASKYHWIRYDTDKMIEIYAANDAKKIGTELHQAASILINNRVKMDDNVKTTFNMYVNDCIFYNMRTEQLLYYSDLFYGTADAINCRDNVLRVFDLKTGKTKASMDQLKIYVAFFMLIYDFIPSDFDDIELRIYQNNDIVLFHPDHTEIVKIMDKIVAVDQIVRQLEDGKS